jgi:hypothetical protein
MMPIFPDDAPLDARREAAYERLLAMCPEPFRLVAKPMARVAIERASEAEIDALLIDIDRIPELAEAGDMNGIVSLAKRYGATDEMTAMYLPLFERAAQERSA